MYILGIDVSGGDFAPQSPVRGAIMAASELRGEAQIMLLGDEKIILAELKAENVNPADFIIQHAPQEISMHEHPTKAVVQKPDSPIVTGLRLMKENKLHAFSSAGNTGAVMVAAMQNIRTIEGVIRPCITSVLPKENGGVSLILDVGSNADCKPDVLYQFGILGAVYYKILTGQNDPRVALLNIGEEPEKGNLVTQSTYQLMKDSKDFAFVGNIEGRDLFNEKCDVIVTEGFTGNVVLKTAEAFYTLIRQRNRSDEYFNRFNYELYGGTPILGVNGTVMIGHGISSPLAIKNMLLLSKQMAENKLNEKIKEAFN